MIEGLEPRRLLAATPHGGSVAALMLYGTESADTIVVRPVAGDASRIQVFVNGQVSTYSIANASQVIVHALGGDDTLDLRRCPISTQIDAGPGNDRVWGSALHDRISAGDGNDWISAGAQTDTVEGGAGRDQFVYGDGKDYLNDFDPREDILLKVSQLPSLAHATLKNGVLRVEGTNSTDHIELGRAGGRPAKNIVVNWNGNSLGSFEMSQVSSILVRCNDGDDDVRFNDIRGDILIPVKLYGGSGNDSIHPGASDARVWGGDGNDFITSGLARATIYGEAGNDSIFGGDEADHLWGGDGNDWIIGAAGKDLLDGGDGNDRLLGNEGRDTLVAGAGSNFLRGGGSKDQLRGDHAADDLDHNPHDFILE